MIWFTSDTHYGHNSIIRYCNRPFKDSTEMDETLIAYWNKVVKVNDTVYHLGDFAFKPAPNYMQRLNGRVHLIRGNHDYRNKKYESFFESVHDLYELKINGLSIVLCHYAMRVWPRSHYNSWHLYGHSHGGLSHGELGVYGKSMDVGVDCNNFTPISLDQVTEKMKTLPDNFNWVKRLPGYDEKEFEEYRNKED